MSVICAHACPAPKPIVRIRVLVLGTRNQYGCSGRGGKVMDGRLRVVSYFARQIDQSRSRYKEVTAKMKIIDIYVI